MPIENRPKHRLLKVISLREIPVECKHFDDAKMLIVKKGYIPSDYKKTFAVSTRPILNNLPEKDYEIVPGKRYTLCINSKGHFVKVLVQKI